MRNPWGHRLAVVGDAAHSTSPQLGQGANLALADALVLTRSLAGARNLQEALITYAAGRRRHVRFYQWASRLLTPFFQSDSRAASRLRDTVLGPMGRLPYFRSEMVATLVGIKTGLLTRLDPGLWHADYALRSAGALERGLPPAAART